MKPTLLLTFVLCALLLTPMARAQDEEAMMEAWMESITPTEHHEVLTAFVGNWQFENTFWMDPAAPPQTSTGTTTGEMIMGGRYLEQHHAGDMMGMPFAGLGLTGYDRVANEYVSAWLDNFGTGILVFRGTARDDGVLDMSASYFDPMTQQDQVHRIVQRIEDKDHLVMEYYVTPAGGEEFKSMVIKYVRPSMQ